MSVKTILLMLCSVHAATAALDDGLYAVFDTSMGSFTCRLDHAEAPLPVANFVGLVEGSQNWLSPAGVVKSGAYYDGLTFHRVIDGFMIQGGDPLGTGTGGPGYSFPDQISTNLRHSAAGILSMANSGPDSNGSQFFITLAATSSLDGVHAVFGAVVDGMDTVAAIGAVATDANATPLTNVVMQTVRILRVGAEAAAYDPTAQPLPEVATLPVALAAAASVATSNQSEQFIFESTNLVDWATAAEGYTPVAASALAAAIPTNNPCGFYRAARVFYPQAVTAFSSTAGRTLRFTQGSSVLTFRPTADGAGTCDIAGNADALGAWADWTTEPFLGIVFFQPATRYQPFYFTLAVDGSCEGYQWNGFGWNSMGAFVFSIAP